MAGVLVVERLSWIAGVGLQMVLDFEHWERPMLIGLVESGWWITMEIRC